MRLWSLHPRLLDRQGLLACWREGLLAQAVLLGQTRGYRNHPQLQRFQVCTDPPGAVGAYLAVLVAEASARGYRFAGDKIIHCDRSVTIPVTEGQVNYELQHLRAKLATRSPERLPILDTPGEIVHPLFRVRPGEVADWERPIAP